MAYSTGSPAKARWATSNGEPGSPSSTNRPFFVPTDNSVISSASGDRGQHVDLVAGLHRRRGLAQLAVDKHVDVAAHVAALVQDPAVQVGVRPLELLQELGHGRAGELVVGLPAGLLLQW